MFDNPLHRYKENEADRDIVEARMKKNTKTEELITFVELYMDKHVFSSDEVDEALAEQVCSLRSTLVRSATRTREIIRRDCGVLEGKEVIERAARWASSVKKQYAKRI